MCFEPDSESFWVCHNLHAYNLALLVQLGQVVWAVDLKLRYSDSMAMTKLMLYVSGGEFQAPQSSFLVPVKKKREESGRRRRRKTVEEEEVTFSDGFIVKTLLLREHWRVYPQCPLNVGCQHS